jgi:HK97 family phage major capsid protein
MAGRLEALKSRKTKLLADSRKLIDNAEASEAGITDDVRAELDRNEAEIGIADDSGKYPAGSINAEIAREERLRAEERTMPAVVESNVNAAADAHIDVKKKSNPWNSFGEQLAAIYAAGAPGGNFDPRLLNAGPSGGSANVGSDGGFLIHKDFSSEVYRRAYEYSAFASRARRVPISADSDGLEVPYIDETSRATGSRLGGVQVYRVAEADTVTAKKPKIGKLETKLTDLMGLAYMTNRLMRDASAMTNIYTQSFAEEFGFVVDDEIVRGVGGAQILGIKNANATVSVAKETNQPAATVNAQNIIKMWSRLWGPSRATAVWFINQDVEPQLYQMQIGTGASGQLVYLPPGGLSASPYGTIFGRPVVPVEQCDTLGTNGDIILADLNQFLLIEKDGMQTDQSMHVRFLYNEQAFRFIMRINGQPIWQSALTPYKGANTLSPYVTLAARA